MLFNCHHIRFIHSDLKLAGNCFLRQVMESEFNESWVLLQAFVGLIKTISLTEMTSSKKSLGTYKS